MCRASPGAWQLDGLYLKPLPPGELLYRLFNAGINIMPEDQDALKAVPYTKGAPPGLVVKTPKMETKLNEDVAMLSGSFDFKSSRWNGTVRPSSLGRAS